MTATGHGSGGGAEGAGVLDLGSDGAAVVCAATTVNLGLRTPAEQDALMAGYGAWLNSLSGPVQVLVRADRIDLEPLVVQLEDGAAELADPALEAAALAHAEFLADLAAGRDLLRRQILLVIREPLPSRRGGPGWAAGGAGPGGTAGGGDGGSAGYGRGFESLSWTPLPRRPCWRPQPSPPAHRLPPACPPRTPPSPAHPSPAGHSPAEAAAGA